MLTTKDNPWSPFTDYEAWHSWDVGHGYHTASLLARVCVTSLDLSDSLINQSIDDAIDAIVTLNASGMHVVAIRPKDDRGEG